MPDYPPPSSQWFANVLARLTAAMQASAVQSTQYVTDPTILTPSATTPNCKAIIGNIGMDNFGNATGLTGWGTAVWNGTSWQNLNAVLGLLSAQKLELQVGQANGLAVAIGFNNVAVTLATTWPTQHVAFLPFINGSGNLAALSYVGANQTSSAQGGVLLNSTAVTTINVGYVSFGN